MGEGHETWVPLIKNVSSLQISYFNPNLNTWIDRWSNTSQMPWLVKVTVGRSDSPSALGSDYSVEADAVLRMKAPNSKLRGGAALMLALWALFLLSAMVISWALDINSRLAVSGNASRVLDAEAMASSGADVALHPLIKPDSANLHGQMGKHEGYDVKMIGECGRLNLNFSCSKARIHEAGNFAPLSQP